jgi:hypothetical protein
MDNKNRGYGLKLFHGSNEKVISPNIYTGRNPLDFGRGFYATTSVVQAENWARRKTVFTARGIPIVNVYDCPDNFLESAQLSVKQFTKADSEWFDFVIANRNEEYRGEQYDIVIGPVADDSVLRVIRMYMNNIYEKDEALQRLKSEILDNQFLFASEKAIKCLIFMEARTI